MTVPTAGSFLLTSNYDALNDQITALENARTNVTQADVLTSSTQTSTSYAAPTSGTAGPALSLSIVNGKRYKITLTIEGSVTTATTTVGRAAVAISGAVTVAATDSRACTTTSLTGNTQSRSWIYTATASGSATFTAQYKVSANSFIITNRTLIVEPIEA